MIAISARPGPLIALPHYGGGDFHWLADTVERYSSSMANNLRNAAWTLYLEDTRRVKVFKRDARGRFCQHA